VLVEVYRTEADPGEHKKTAHYQKWRDTVAHMMAEPRSGAKNDDIWRDGEGWGKASYRVCGTQSADSTASQIRVAARSSEACVG
jgi:hypothetical protein